MIRKASLIFALFLVLITSAATAQDTTLDNLADLMDAVFPGTANIEIEGELVSAETPQCHNELRTNPPQGYILTPDSQDPEYFPLVHFLYATVLVTDPDQPDVTFPANIYLTVIDPDWQTWDSDRAMLMPIDPYEHSRDSADPHAVAMATIQNGQVNTNRQDFNRNTDGKMLFKYENPGNGLVESRRMSFDFAVENEEGQEVHVRGAIHNFVIPRFFSHESLRGDRSTLVALSGIAYAVTDQNTIQVEERIIDGEAHYVVHLETMAILKGADNNSPVPVAATFAAVKNDDKSYREVVLNSEITVNHLALTDYTAHPELRELSTLHFVANDDVISGTVRLAFSNGCGGFLQLDLLFRDIPLTETPD